MDFKQIPTSIYCFPFQAVGSDEDFHRYSSVVTIMNFIIVCFLIVFLFKLFTLSYLALLSPWNLTCKNILHYNWEIIEYIYSAFPFKKKVDHQAACVIYRSGRWLSWASIQFRSSNFLSILLKIGADKSFIVSDGCSQKTIVSMIIRPRVQVPSSGGTTQAPAVGQGIGLLHGW